MADSPENVDYEFVIPEDYDFSKSTEENYRAECPVFKGKYKHHRKVLDYSYHSHYTASRQRLHDQLIDRFHATRVHDEKRNAFCEAPLQNWIVFTAGPMGAGKSHTINWLNTQKIFPLDAFVRVDPDQIRELLPETKQYNQLDCSQTGFLTQREVGYISEVLTIDALEKGKNVLLDSSMRDAGWFEKYFDYLHESFPSLKIAILCIDAERESIFARAKRRAKVTGRMVPEHVIIDALERVPETMAALRPKADFFATIRNEDGIDPFMTECEGHDGALEWGLQRTVDGHFLRFERQRSSQLFLKPSSESPSARPPQIESTEVVSSWKDIFSSVWVMECALPSTLVRDISSGSLPESGEKRKRTSSEDSTLKKSYDAHGRIGNSAIEILDSSNCEKIESR